MKQPFHIAISFFATASAWCAVSSPDANAAPKNCVSLNNWHLRADGIKGQSYINKTGDSTLLEYTTSEDDPVYVYLAEAKVVPGLYTLKGRIRFGNSPYEFTVTMDDAFTAKGLQPVQFSGSSGGSLELRGNIQLNSESASIKIRSAAAAGKKPVYSKIWSFAAPLTLCRTKRL